jgi:hypothetical protein
LTAASTQFFPAPGKMTRSARPSTIFRDCAGRVPEIGRVEELALRLAHDAMNQTRTDLVAFGKFAGDLVQERIAALDIGAAAVMTALSSSSESLAMTWGSLGLLCYAQLVETF